MNDEDTALTPIETPSIRFSAQFLCQRCGSIVLDGWQDTHVNWHYANDVTLVGRTP
jgi:hypothetical protein